MSYSPRLSSGFTFVRNRRACISTQSGMYLFCTQDCDGTCELAQAAVWEPRQSTGNNQIASEKDYPLDISHFNITGRVFGAQGVDETQSEATIFNVNLERTNGSFHLVKFALPVILPALLDWEFELVFTDMGLRNFPSLH